MKLDYQLDELYSKVFELRNVEMVPKDFTGIVEVYEEDILGREFIFSIQYLINGKVHRDNGPAVIWYNGNQYWYQNGEPHRVDGPSAIFHNGRLVWALNGKEVSMAEVFELMTPEQKEYAIWNYFGG